MCPRYAPYLYHFLRITRNHASAAQSSSKAMIVKAITRPPSQSTFVIVVTSSGVADHSVLLCNSAIKYPGGEKQIKKIENVRGSVRREAYFKRPGVSTHRPDQVGRTS
jgi:hypothetical protein